MSQKALFDKYKIRQLRISLTAKVILVVSLTLIIVMGLFTYYEMETSTKFHFKQQEERAVEISDTVMRSIEYPMLDGEMEDVQAILERLNTLMNVTIVNLCDIERTIKYSGLPNNIGTVDNSEVTLKALRTNSLIKGIEKRADKKILYFAIPIANEKSCFKCHGAEKKLLGVLTVGIRWEPIEQRIAEIRNNEITLALVSVMVVGFFLTLLLSKYITKPLSILTQLADEISRGMSGFEFGRTIKCWEVEKCDKYTCPAYGNTDIMCWYVDGTLCKVQPSGDFPQKLDMCLNCSVYKTHVGDEMVKLADSFKHMLYKLMAFEKELMRSEEKYRLLFETDPNPIFILARKDLIIIDANIRAESQYGYKKEELLKMHFTDLGYKEDEKSIISDMNISDNRCVLFTKKRHHRKDGSQFYTNIHVCNIQYMGKDALIATTTDVTADIQKETQLIQASKLATLGEMAAGIAHELNQPLNVMQVGSDFLNKMVKKGKKISDEELTTVAEQISGQVNRASKIINHLREFTRAAEINSHQVDINKPIKDVFKILGQQLRLHQIEYKLDLDKKLPPIMADTNKLEQILINLVKNAMDTMDEKKSDTNKILSIKSFLDNNEVVVIVSDTGKGIPADLIDRIFEPFFTTKEVGKGTGLGLSISYVIVKDYKGNIMVKSDEDIGTTFEIRFPVAQEER